MGGKLGGDPGRPHSLTGPDQKTGARAGRPVGSLVTFRLTPPRTDKRPGGVPLFSPGSDRDRRRGRLGLGQGTGGGASSQQARGKPGAGHRPRSGSTADPPRRRPRRGPGRVPGRGSGGCKVKLSLPRTAPRAKPGVSPGQGPGRGPGQGPGRAWASPRGRAPGRAPVQPRAVVRALPCFIAGAGPRVVPNVREDRC